MSLILSADQMIDQKSSCLIFSNSVQKTLIDLIGIETNLIQRSHSVAHLETHEDLFVSILFKGEIYGEFLIGLNKISALKMLKFEFEENDELSVYIKNKTEIIETFKEVINMAAIHALNEYKSLYPELTITPPKAVEGSIYLANYPIEKTKLFHDSGDISCYIYVDYMKC